MLRFLEDIVNSTTTETIEETPKNSVNSFGLFMSKTFMILGVFAMITIIILLIIAILYCYAKYKKASKGSNDVSSLSFPKVTPESGKHYDFKKIQNTSSVTNDGSSVNKGNMSLSELRVQNLKLETGSLNTNGESATSDEKRKSGRKGKKKSARSSSGDDDSSSNKKTKKLEKAIQKQIEKYVGDDEDI